MLSNGAVGAISNNAADTTQQLTVRGRVPSGAIETEVLNLNGTTRVVGSKVFERILELSLDGVAAGDVTVDRNTDSVVVKAIPAGLLLIHRSFYDSRSEATPTNRYEKIFAKNLNISLTLTNAVVKLTQDPAAKIMIGLDAAKDDASSVANRKTAPGAVTFVDDNVGINVPGTTLEAAAAIGIWKHQGLGAGDAPFKSIYEIEVSGTSA